MKKLAQANYDLDKTPTLRIFITFETMGSGSVALSYHTKRSKPKKIFVAKAFFGDCISRTFEVVVDSSEPFSIRLFGGNNITHGKMTLRTME